MLKVCVIFEVHCSGISILEKDHFFVKNILFFKKKSQ